MPDEEPAAFERQGPFAIEAHAWLGRASGACGEGCEGDQVAWTRGFGVLGTYRFHPRFAASLGFGGLFAQVPPTLGLVAVTITPGIRVAAPVSARLTVLLDAGIGYSYWLWPVGLEHVDVLGSSAHPAHRMATRCRWALDVVATPSTSLVFGLDFELLNLVEGDSSSRHPRREEGPIPFVGLTLGIAAHM
ncbi:MAG: hypothetical protein FJ087_02905 [Deltaproteobacteria bacterium]|nr:hypothetical protein [Deltaproteobacteria bacterium]